MLVTKKKHSHFDELLAILRKLFQMLKILQCCALPANHLNPPKNDLNVAKILPFWPIFFFSYFLPMELYNTFPFFRAVNDKENKSYIFKFSKGDQEAKEEIRVATKMSFCLPNADFTKRLCRGGK